MQILAGLALAFGPAPLLGGSNDRPLVVAHYMIWFQSGGAHWAPQTQSNPAYFDRFSDGCDNQHKLPTWFPPIEGPFSSDDEDHIRSGLTRMRDHGIDGLIFDYQQPCHKPERDFVKGALKTAMGVIEKEFPSLQFAIMYDLASACDGAWDYPGRNQDWGEVIGWAQQSPNYLTVKGKS